MDSRFGKHYCIGLPPCERNTCHFCRCFLYDACFIVSGALPNDLDAKTSCAASHHLAHLARQYVSTYFFFGNIDIFHFDLGNFVYMLDTHSPRNLSARLPRTCRDISRAL